MLLTTLSSLLLATASVQAVETTYHLDTRAGVFQVKFLVPEAEVKDATLLARPKDNSLFLMHASRTSQSRYERLRDEVRKQEQEEQALTDFLAQVRKLCSTKGDPREAVWSVDYDAFYRSDCKKKLKPLEAKLKEEQASLNKSRASLQQEENAGQRVECAVLGRFIGSQPTSVDVFVKTRGRDEQLLTTVDIKPPKQPVSKRDVLEAWWQLEQGAFEGTLVLGGASELIQYALLTIPQRLNVPNDDPRSCWWREMGRAQPDSSLFGVMSGRTAVSEALQLQALRDDGKDDEKQTIPITTLKGPEIASHDFDKLRADAPMPSGFAAAEAIPADAFALHFTSASAAFRVMDLVDDWGTDLAHGIEGAARDHGTKERLDRQLALPRNAMTRLFADQAIESVSITGHDPYFRGGTDITVILQVKQNELAKRTLDAARQMTASAFPNTTETTESYKGVRITQTKTPNRELSRVYAETSRYIFVGNSMEGVKRCLDTLASQKGSLAKSPDYQYLRATLGNDGDAFIYLTDAFVRNVVGPRWKIVGQRRDQCATHLQMIEMGRVLAMRERSAARTLEQLQQEAWLPPNLRCAHGGTYSLDERGAACSVHGRLSFLTPIVELPIGKATKSEAEAYEQYSEEYKTFWRRFVDPVGVKLKIGQAIEAETLILPLVEDTIYSGLAEVFSRSSTPLANQGLSDKSIFSVSGAVNLNRNHGLTHELGQWFEHTYPIDEWLGDQASLVVYDGDPSFSASSSGQLPFLGERGGFDFGIVLATGMSLISMPSAIVVQVKDGEKARAAMASLAGRWSSHRSWLERSSSTYHRGGENGQEGTDVLTFKVMGVTFRLYFRVLKDQLYISTRPWLVDEMVARGSVVAPSTTPAEPGHLRVRIEHGHMKQALMAAREGWSETMREACHHNLPDLQFVAQSTIRKDLAAGVKEALSYRPYCPSGGTYQFGPDEHISCSVHGTLFEPRQPVEKDSVRSAQWLDRFDDIDLTLTFTKEGLHSKVRLVPKPSK